MLNGRIKNLKLSSTLALVLKANELREKGKKVISLSVGEPDFPTPDYIKEAGIKAIKNGKTRYTPASGIKELKEALIDIYEKEQSYRFDINEVMVHPGSKFSIFLVANTILSEGDRVLIPLPYWVSYPEIIKFTGAEPVFVNSWNGNKFYYKYEDYEKEIKKGIKLFILSSPSNPTGIIMGKEELQKLLKAAVDYDFYLLIDECYRRIIYDGATYPSPLKVYPEAKERVIVSGSFSKTFAMTGWRIGFTFAPKEIIKYMGILQSHSTSNPATPSQYAALAALTEEKDEVNKMVKEYQRRRDLALELLNKIPQIKITKPEGAFYLFPYLGEAIKGKFNSTYEFSEYLIEKFHVVVVPGESFGLEGFIRISYAASEDDIKEGILKIAEAING